FGNEQRNRLYGPGFQNFDLTVQRALKFGPRLAATLRLDIFNVFNTVNFGLPNKDVSTPATFGTISGLASDPRTMQLALRLAF
ncbi:MAG: Cna domain protein, partial [Acidobacteria bacterium]|nr:Cna domain protein [Acidobacteriota bacterium]